MKKHDYGATAYQLFMQKCSPKDSKLSKQHFDEMRTVAEAEMTDSALSNYRLFLSHLRDNVILGLGGIYHWPEVDKSFIDDQYDEVMSSEYAVQLNHICTKVLIHLALNNRNYEYN